MMSTIKTVQPYKLFKKFVGSKKSVRNALIGAIGLIILLTIHDPFAGLLFIALVVSFSPIMVYNPQLKANYEPGVSYSWVKDYVNGKAPSSLIKGLIVGGLVGGLLFDLLDGSFPGFTILFLIIFSLGALALYKYPQKMLYWKSSRLRILNHQNIDYNVKVDLNKIYGIKDKMVLSYQNFHFNQKHLEKGNYLLGVSPLGVYFAHKSDSVHKSFIKFEDIDTIGLLAAIDNLFVFNIKSKSGIEINIIIDEDDSNVVSTYKLFETILDTLDSFLLNDSVGTTSATRRRRITVSPSSTDSTINKTDDVVVDTGRSIELETTTEGPTDKQSTNTNRVVDISFTETVIAELAAGEMITSNRQIEI